MAVCTSCGRTTGFGITICRLCDPDRAQKAELERQALAEQRHAQQLLQEQQRNMARQQAIECQNREAQQMLNALLQRVELYGQVTLYRSVYMPVDSVLQGESLAPAFDIFELQALGLKGWEVCGVVPRTIGVDLQNVSIGVTSGKTYGGGVGGNVAGVHVLLQRIVRGPVAESMHDELRAILGSQLASRS